MSVSSLAPTRSVDTIKILFCAIPESLYPGGVAAARTWNSPIDRQVLIYLSVDDTMSGKSLRTYGSGYFQSTERVAWYFDNDTGPDDGQAPAAG